MKTKLSIALLVLSAVAEAQTCTQTVPVSVLDQKTGLSIPSLQSQVFHAKSGSTVLPVVALNPVKTLRVLVLIDASGSMAHRTEPGVHLSEAIQKTEDGLLEFAKQSPEVSVQFGFFNVKTVFTNRFTSQPQELLSDIQEAKTKFGKIGFGSTPIYDAVHAAILRFQPIQPGDSIVLLTDGAENRSKLTAKDVKQELRVSGVRLFTLLIFTPELAASGEEIADLDEFAESSGGAVVRIDVTDFSWADKKAVAENIKPLKLFWTQQVLNGYLLSVQLPADLKKDQKWSLTLDSPAKGQSKNIALHYPKRLLGCSVSSASR